MATAPPIVPPAPNPYPTPTPGAAVALAAGAAFDGWVGQLTPAVGVLGQVGTHLVNADTGRVAFGSLLAGIVPTLPSLQVAPEASELARVLGLQDPGPYQAARSPIADPPPAPTNPSLGQSSSLLTQWLVYLRYIVRWLLGPWFLPI